MLRKLKCSLLNVLWWCSNFQGCEYIFLSNNYKLRRYGEPSVLSDSRTRSKPRAYNKARILTGCNLVSSLYNLGLKCHAQQCLNTWPGAELLHGTFSPMGCNLQNTCSSCIVLCTWKEAENTEIPTWPVNSTYLKHLNIAKNQVLIPRATTWWVTHLDTPAYQSPTASEIFKPSERGLEDPPEPL